MKRNIMKSYIACIETKYTHICKIKMIRMVRICVKRKWGYIKESYDNTNKQETSTR